MPNGLTCFLIDNDKDDQEIFSLALAEVDPSIHLDTASNGLEAIRRLKEVPPFTPDCIFIDMNMPLMNGRECLAEIKKIERLANIPVYIYSTAANPTTIDELKREGVTDFIVKPTSFTGLVAVLFNLCKPKNVL